jgi:DNA modification methylase
LQGDCRDVLPTLPSESVHCVVTSPPYYGLRDYGTAQWAGGDADCNHARPFVPRDQRPSGDSHIGHGGPSNDAQDFAVNVFRQDCGKCGAARIDSQLGLESTPAEYIATMVGVFREVRRVLRSDGTLWLNIGDSYSGGTMGRNDMLTLPRPKGGHRTAPDYAISRANVAGLKPKDLIGIPWMLAFALRDDGWYLRSDIIWSKPNPMPESVTDRPTKAHEYLFLFTKRARYYYDADAIREPNTESTLARHSGPAELPHAHKTVTAFDHRGTLAINGNHTDGRNKRSVWEIATEPFPEAHFATYPTALVEPCIKAGTSERGVCSECGAPWMREREPTPGYAQRLAHANDRGGWYDRATTTEKRVDGTKQGKQEGGITAEYVTVGWRPSCAHGAEPVPATVLDPFAGAGTTGLVADRLGRDAVLIELSPSYATMGRDRIIGDAPMFASVSQT